MNKMVIDNLEHMVLCSESDLRRANIAVKHGKLNSDGTGLIKELNHVITCEYALADAQKKLREATK